MSRPANVADEALVARVAAREEDALGALYDRYRRLVFALALRILKDRAEAEEILSDVFLQVWRTAGTFDGRRGSVSSWLVTLCRSRAIDRIRSRGRREDMTVAMDLAADQDLRAPSRDSDPEAAAETALDRRRILRALGALPGPQRRAIELAYYGDLTHAEIAGALGEPLGTVKSRIRTALFALRDGLLSGPDRGPEVGTEGA